MSEKRASCLQNLKDTTECNIVLVTKENLKDYILPTVPLHPSYEFLSETHKSDYLRTYFMHFYGGGYSDIKKTTGSWRQAFDDLENSDKWINGYKESEFGLAYEPARSRWQDLIGVSGFICKAGTPLTEKWYNEMFALMDTKLEALRKHPATMPAQHESQDNYPVEWNEMLGRIFHKICYENIDKLLSTLPRYVSLVNTDYR